MIEIVCAGVLAARDVAMKSQQTAHSCERNQRDSCGGDHAPLRPIKRQLPISKCFCGCPYRHRHCVCTKGGVGEQYAEESFVISAANAII